MVEAVTGALVSFSSVKSDSKGRKCKKAVAEAVLGRSGNYWAGAVKRPCEGQGRKPLGRGKGRGGGMVKNAKKWDRPRLTKNTKK